jgi:hypothetical protein
MVKKLRRSKDGKNHHPKKRMIDLDKPEKPYLQNPDQLTKKEIEDNIQLFEDFIEKDLQYMHEERINQKSFMQWLAASTIIFIIGGLLILNKGSNAQILIFTFIALLVELLIFLRYDFSRESYKRWEGFLNVHLRYLDGWKIRQDTLSLAPIESIIDEALKQKQNPK